MRPDPDPVSTGRRFPPSSAPCAGDLPIALHLDVRNIFGLSAEHLYYKFCHSKFFTLKERTTMNATFKDTLLVLAGFTIGLAAQAQTFVGTIQMPGGGTRQLIKPADATSGTATAGPSMVIPVMPSNMCTADNNNCVTTTNIPQTVLPIIPVPAPTQGSFCGQVIYTAPDSQGYTPSGYAPQGTTSERHCNGTTLSLSGPWYAPTGIANCPSGYLSGMTGPAIPGFSYLTSGPDGGASTITGGPTYVFTCFKS